MKKSCLFLLALIFTFCSVGQKELLDTNNYILFIDDSTFVPVPHTIVLINGNVIAMSDEKGVINTDFLNCNDTVVIAKYGYKTIRINCDELKREKTIKLKATIKHLSTVDLIYEDVEPLFKDLKKQKHPKYFAQYYFTYRVIDNKHRVIFFADLMANIYDTGKESKFPYKIEFLAKRTSKLKSNKFYFFNQEGKLNLEKEMALTLRNNKTRTDKLYKHPELFDIKTLINEDTTILTLIKKNNTLYNNILKIKMYNDSLSFFYDKWEIINKELINRYEDLYKEKKMFYKVPIIFYRYFTVNYSKNRKQQFIPAYYTENIQFELLNKLHLHYNTFSVQKTLTLVKVLDINSVKNVTFSKKGKDIGEPIDSLPTIHSYLDTIPFPNLK